MKLSHIFENKVLSKNKDLEVDFPNEYKDFLQYAESSVKDGLTKMFNENQTFAKCFFFEVYTGIIKFGGNGKETPSNVPSPIANFLIKVPNEFYEISTTESPIIIKASKKFGIRLQNVPRGDAGKFVSRADVETRNLEFLLDCLTEIELSLKIGIDPKKSLLEFSNSQIDNKVFEVAIRKLQKAIKKSSIIEIMLAFNIWFKGEVSE